MDPVNNNLPASLLDLFSNDLILRLTSPYIGIRSLLSLAATSKAYKSLVYRTPHVFQHVNLCGVKALTGFESESDGLIDDQKIKDLCAHRFRIIFTILGNRNVIQHVRTLILDGLCVPSTVVDDILCNDRYRIHLLSLRRMAGWSTDGALRIIHHLVRPSRPKGTPKLRGLYCFGLSNSIQEVLNVDSEVRRRPKAIGVTASMGAQLGADNQMDDDLDDFRKQFGEDPYSDSPYGALGTSNALAYRYIAPEWAETLEACSGLIAFDGVLCRHNRESVPDRRPKLATVRLTGCKSCGSSPEGPAYPGVSPTDHLPLLWPPPLHSSKVEVAQRIDTHGQPYPPLILRCRTCLKDRWCKTCNVWWCESCYTIPNNRGPTERILAGTATGLVGGHEVKVHNGLCVEKCLMGELLNGVGEGGMWG